MHDQILVVSPQSVTCHVFVTPGLCHDVTGILDTLCYCGLTTFPHSGLELTFTLDTERVSCQSPSNVALCCAVPCPRNSYGALYISVYSRAETENTGLLFGFYKTFNLISSSEGIYRARRINNQINIKLHSEATGLGVVPGERKC